MTYKLSTQLRTDPSTALNIRGALMDDKAALEKQRAQIAMQILDAGPVDIDGQLKYNKVLGALHYVDSLLKACENSEEHR